MSFLFQLNGEPPRTKREPGRVGCYVRGVCLKEVQYALRSRYERDSRGVTCVVQEETRDRTMNSKMLSASESFLVRICVIIARSRFSGSDG